VRALRCASLFHAGVRRIRVEVTKNVVTYGVSPVEKAVSRFPARKGATSKVRGPSMRCSRINSGRIGYELLVSDSHFPLRP